MRLKEFINELKKHERVYGNLDVLISSDEEGNSFGGVDKESFQLAHKKKGGHAVLITVFGHQTPEQLFE